MKTRILFCMMIVALLIGATSCGWKTKKNETPTTSVTTPAPTPAAPNLQAQLDSLTLVNSAMRTELDSCKKTIASITGTPKSVIGKPKKGEAIQDDATKTYIVRESDKNDVALIAKMPAGYTLKTVPR